MRNNGEIARSSRGRTIIRSRAAIAGAACRRGKVIARGSRGGRGAATAPRGGRRSATARGRGAATAPRGGRGAATASRGPRVRRLEYVMNDEAENDDAYAGDGDEDEDEDEEETEDEALEEGENEAEEECDDEAEDDGGDLWLRGPAGLPPLPANEHEKWVLEPSGDTQWKELGGGVNKRRAPNGVITVILKEKYPGLVEFNGRTVHPTTWKHFAAAPDVPDEDGVQCDSCLERVEETFWQYFRWATYPEDTEADKRRNERDARRVLRNVVKKRITQLYYEARLSAVGWYYAKRKKERLTKEEAKEIRLTEAQYVSPLRPSKMDILLSPSSKSYYACVGESTYAYQSPSKDLNAINNHLKSVCSGEPQKSGKKRLTFDVVSDQVVASSLNSDQNACRAAMEVDPVKTPVKCEPSEP